MGLPIYLQLDHINGDRLDNRLSNLRLVSRKENAQNIRTPTKRTSTGMLGVIKRNDKYYAQITVSTPSGRICISKGSFSSKEEAYEQYVLLKRTHHEGCTL
jgi:hypothetical protein